MNDGGGIDTKEATLTLSNSTFTNNQSAEDGGAVFNYAGTADISGSTFNKNSTSGRGGAVENTGRSVSGPAPQGVMTIESSNFTNNAAADGGAIDNNRDSQLTITGGIINSNTASDSGGGVSNSETASFGPGTLTISGSTIANNTAANVGGGVLSQSSNTTIENGTVIKNNSAGEGGGISRIDGSDLSVDSTTFTGNSSTVNDGGGIDTEEGILTLLQLHVHQQPKCGRRWSGVQLCRHR